MKQMVAAQQARGPSSLGQLAKTSPALGHQLPPGQQQQQQHQQQQQQQRSTSGSNNNNTTNPQQGGSGGSQQPSGPAASQIAALSNEKIAGLLQDLTRKIKGVETAFKAVSASFTSER